MSKLKASIDAAKNFVDMRVHGAAPAPYRAIALIQGACDLNKSLDECFADEDKALGDLIKSRQCKAGVYSFDLDSKASETNPWRSEGREAPSVNKIGIIGAGLMASQLAILFLRRYGVPVVMKDIKQEFLDKGMGYVKGELAALVGKGRMTKPKGIICSDCSSGHSTGTILRIAISSSRRSSRKWSIKQEVFAKAEAVVSPTCILATNTSSLSITEMASKLQKPRASRRVSLFQSRGDPASLGNHQGRKNR